MKIRAHLTLIITAALLPVVVFSGLAVNLLLDAAQDSALRGMHETARATALSVDRELASAEAALKVLATSPLLGENDLAAFYRQARAADRGYGSWTTLLDAQGSQLSNTGIPSGTTLPVGAETERVNQVLSGQRIVVSDLFIDPRTQRHVTTLNLPVETSDGKRFVVSSVFGAEFFATALAESKIPANWTVGIMDRQGKFIARNRDPENKVGTLARPELIAASRQSDAGYLRHKTWEGMDAYDVFSHSQISGWTVAVAAPVAEIQGAARQAVMISGLGLLAAIAAAAAVAALFSRHLVRAIDSIDKAAAALVRGKALPEVTSVVAEIIQLNRSLRQTGLLLEEERSSRRQVELEREGLLVQAQKARLDAERENSAKDKFLAMLGHELRNPLAAISGAIALGKAAQVSPTGRAHADAVIERQSDHLRHIVDDLLDHSRVTMGKIRLECRPLNLAAVVDTCLDALRAAPRAQAQNIRVLAQPVWISGDTSRLEQIVNNLVGNAQKFTPDGGIIDVTVTADAGFAVLQVKDNGSGIAPDLLLHIFEPFVQGAPPRNGVSAMHGGLGIGLNLVRQLVELHGGSVAAASDGAEAGSTFTVRFPLCEAPSQTATVLQGPATPLAGKVLLIEDNDDAREMMAALLDLNGLQVFEARTGQDGLAQVKTMQASIAIIDIGLPDMSGYAVAAALRADPATRDMLLVALTGYGQADDVQRALAAGFNLHFAKPIEFDALLAALRELNGLQVFEARTGGDGLAQIKTIPASIAIIDIGLPDMSGYAVAAALRADLATRDMLLVALTGYGQADDVQRALAAGFNLHFAKPIEFDALLAALSAQAGA